jgi:type II secretory pathway pseudopilin PulG
MSKSILHGQSGFSAVEMLITIIVAAMFIISFNTLFLTITQTSAQTRYRSVANDLAYANLRQYVSADAKPTWFVCSTAAGSSNTNDSTVNANAQGQVLKSGTLTKAATTLPEPISYSVRALAIYGCSGTNAGKPLRVESTITYGPSALVIKHGTLIGY